MTVKAKRLAGLEAAIAGTLAAIRAAGLPGIYEEAVGDLAGYVRRQKGADADCWVTVVNSHAEDQIRKGWDEDGAWRQIRGIITGDAR
jgi:hypothetical protein